MSAPRCPTGNEIEVGSDDLERGRLYAVFAKNLLKRPLKNDVKLNKRKEKPTSYPRKNRHSLTLEHWQKQATHDQSTVLRSKKVMIQSETLDLKMVQNY